MEMRIDCLPSLDTESWTQISPEDSDHQLLAALASHRAKYSVKCGETNREEYSLFLSPLSNSRNADRLIIFDGSLSENLKRLSTT